MKLKEFQEQLLQDALNAGFTEVELYYEQKESFQCMIFEGEIDSYETSEDGGLGLRGLYNGKMGYSYTEKIDEDSISFLIESAKANAAILDEDDGSDIFEGSKNYETHCFYNEELANVQIPEKIELLRSIEEKVRSYDERIVTLDECILYDFATGRSLANSKGLSLSEKKNGFLIYISTVVKNGEEMKTGSFMKSTRDFHSLNADEIAKEAAEEALSYLGEKSIPAGKYPIIMRYDAAASLLDTFSSIFSAENTQKNQSLLKGKIGEKVAADTLTLLDDPFHPKNALGGSNFDGEGVATRKQAIITNGTLVTLLHNRKTAKKESCESTGNASKASYKGTLSVAAQNMYIAPGEKSKEDLIASVAEGILVTKLSGLHSGTNTISGDFSVAATGFHIKDGKIASPVKQITIAGNFYDLLKNIEETCSDLHFQQSGFGSPSLLVKELYVTVD
ncbi:TldD/PmbA family protein [Rummeliibacillus pycnus]|uniref:TldD/PmbA family protein n=1 Tax=Rummeliibacillus pycnus TaxID=101070 RepID=UPI003D269E55